MTRIIRSSPFGAGATPEGINAATTAMRAMKNGDAISLGQIMDSTGKQVVPAGTTYGPMPTNFSRPII